MAPAFLRSPFDRLSAAIAGAALRVFFRKVEVVGAERIPRRVPTILIANHVNNLIDPMVIMAFLAGGPRFLAKSTLWSHPLVAPLLVLVEALPGDVPALPGGPGPGGHRRPLPGGPEPQRALAASPQDGSGAHRPGGGGRPRSARAARGAAGRRPARL